jgi:phosphate starvation-inducible protein PhoH
VRHPIVQQVVDAYDRHDRQNIKELNTEQHRESDRFNERDH